MRWINLADKQPAKEKTVIRDIDTKVCLDWMDIRRITPQFITVKVNDEFGDEDFPCKEYEWLDETSVDEKTMKLLYGESNGLNLVSKVLNNKETAKEWLNKIGISPNAVVDDRVKTFPEEFLRYDLWELLNLYHIHITKTNQ